MTAWIYRGALKAAAKGDAAPELIERPSRLNAKKTPFLVKSLIVTLAAVVLFFLGAPMHLVALGAAALLLLERLKPVKVYRHIDWGLLLMFAGLFVVVHAFEVNVVERFKLAEWPPLREYPVGLLSVVSAVLSNIVSNVPAVLLFKPIVPALPRAVQESAWLALGHVQHVGRQLDGPRLGRQSDRGGAGPQGGDDDHFLGLLSYRRPGDADYFGDRDRLAAFRSLLRRLMRFALRARWQTILLFRTRVCLEVGIGECWFPLIEAVFD